ncbi:MAG TPA: alpha/beta hydrolase [Candidatus Hydrogenedentes bacterium]|nr:alpha/beta hydrolase [Candidatus Hydrogenedentota bacterium]
MSDYVICVRNTFTKDRTKHFGDKPGPTKFLRVPDGELPSPEKSRGQLLTRTDWLREVLEEAQTGIDDVTGKPVGDVPVFVHGYNNSQEVVMQRQRTLKKDVEDLNYGGAVIAYGWPSGTTGMAYLEDRDDAKDTAHRLRDDCIAPFKRQQEKDCEFNLHLLAHSTGAYVIRQSFSDADESASIKNFPWKASQIAFIGADVSRRSMKDTESHLKFLYRHCVRLTNYQNPHDSVLKLSNTKRIGLAPRVGRVGLPDNAGHKAVNVNCCPYYHSLDIDALTQGVDYHGSFCHSCYFPKLLKQNNLRTPTSRFPQPHNLCSSAFICD